MAGPALSGEDLCDPNIAPNPTYDRAVRRLPGEVLASLNERQLQALEYALRSPNAAHRIDFRASIPWIGGSHYIVFLFGRESRSRERLQIDGQLNLGRIAVSYGLFASSIAGAMLLSAAVLVYSVAKLLEDDHGSRSEISCLRTH